MGNNGFVTETAHLNVDKKKFSDGYDRIFSAYCYVCETKGKKSNMTKLKNDEYICKGNCKDDYDNNDE